MNRQARRNAERQGEKSTVIQQITSKQLDEAIEQIKINATFGAVKVITAIMAISLNDEYNFGTTRIQKLIERMRSQLECVQQETVDINDIYKWCDDKAIKLF